MKSLKILLLGRHGECPQRADGEGSVDKLKPESVTDVYERIGKPLRERVLESGITPERTFLTHSDKVRTKATGQAILVGAFDLQPRTGENPPSSQEGLENYDFLGIEMSEDPRLGYSDIKLNNGLASNGCYDININHWLAHPDATEHEGVPITPYKSVRQKRKEFAKDAVGRLFSEEKDLGITPTHATVADSVALALIETARSTPIKDIGEIGGGFNMAEFAQLVVEESQGGVYTAKLKLRDEDYPVDLDRL
jgi:hypothetical protein